MLRIARTRTEGFEPAGTAASPAAEVGGGGEITSVDPATLSKDYDTFFTAASRTLPETTMSVLAKPVAASDGKSIDWFTALEGQPTPLSKLAATNQDAVRALLNDRLEAITSFATELERGGGQQKALAESLRQWVYYPSEEQVFVVSGNPVITFWGHQRPGKAPLGPMSLVNAAAASSAAAAAAAEAQAAAGVAARSNMIRNSILGVLGLALLGTGAWWLMKSLAEDPMQDLLALLENGECKALEELRGQAQPYAEDPRFEIFKTRLERRFEDCEYERVRMAVNDAADNCPALLKVSQAEPLLASEESRYVDLNRTLVRGLSDCDYERVAYQVADTRDDCPASEMLFQSEPLIKTEDARYQVLAEVMENRLDDCTYQRVRNDVEDAKDICPDLRAIRTEEPLLESGEARYVDLRNVVDDGISDCEFERIETALDDAGEDCVKVEDLMSTEDLLAKGEGRYSPLNANAAGIINECRAEEEKKLCPGQRPAESAPELVVLFDASGSMNMPISSTYQYNPYIGQVPVATGPPRMTVAKNALKNLIGNLPKDVSTGLVLAAHCSGARSMGFFSPSQRSKLLGLVSGLSAYSGTPLAHGVRQAGSLIDGVNKPALMVVISDGDESCGGNPCAEAQRLAAQKPQLKINVVDILGTGAGNCLAQVTGGRVFTARNAKEVSEMTDQAAKEGLSPQGCDN